MSGFDERLRRNPYDLCALVGAFLHSAADRDFAEAKRLASLCEQLGILRAGKKYIDAVAGGAMPVLRHGNLFCTRLPLDAPAEAFFECVETALTALSRATGRDVPLLWIDFQDAPAHANTIRRDAPGLCRMTLSTELFAADAWAPTIWHECGHAVMTANCRFLDEGWAVWCQYQSGALSFFPAMPEEAAEMEIAPAIAEIPLEGFLRFDAGDPSFRDIVESDDEQIAVYLRAYRLISALIDAGGCVRLAEAFAEIAAGGAVLGILAALAPHVIAADTEKTSLAGIDRAYRWLRSRHATAGAIFLPQVRAMVEKAPDRVEGWELLGRMVSSLALNLSPATPARADLVDELEAIIARLEGLAPGNAIAEMLRGLHAVSQIGLVPSALLQSVSSKAEAHLLKAREMHPGDGDLNIALAWMEIKKPFYWTVDRANALTYLASAAGDSRCRWEAVSVASRLCAAPQDGRLSP